MKSLKKNIYVGPIKIQDITLGTGDVAGNTKDKIPVFMMSQKHWVWSAQNKTQNASSNLPISVLSQWLP